VTAVVREVCNACLTDPSWGCDPRSVDPTTKIPRRPPSVDLFPRLAPPPASALEPERGPPPIAGALFPAIRPPPDVVRPPRQGPVSRFPDGTFGEPPPPRSPPPALTPCREAAQRLGRLRVSRGDHLSRWAMRPPGQRRSLPVRSPGGLAPELLSQGHAVLQRRVPAQPGAVQARHGAEGWRWLRLPAGQRVSRRHMHYRCMLGRDDRHASELPMPTGHGVAARGTREGPMPAAGGAETGLPTGHGARQHWFLRAQVERLPHMTPSTPAARARALPYGARYAQHQIAVHS
jgi:hypothetical protein